MGFLKELKNGAGAVAGTFVRAASLTVLLPVVGVGKIVEKLGAEEAGDTILNAAAKMGDITNDVAEEIDEVVADNIGSIIIGLGTSYGYDKLTEKNKNDKKTS